MSKKKIILIVSVVIIIVLAAGSSAFFVKSGISKNTITASNVKIDVVMTEEKNGSTVVVSGKTPIVPGSNVSRIARVKNTGKEDAWVRVYLSVSDGNREMSVHDFGYVEVDGINTTSWTEKDGYYYYDRPLASGETSDPLFDELRFADDMGNSYAGSNLSFNVNGEGTQVKHNGDSALDAQGWPGN